MPAPTLAIILLVVALLACVLVKALRYRAWEIADMKEGEFPRPVVLPGQLVANHSVPPSGDLARSDRGNCHSLERRVARRVRAQRPLDPGPYAA
jgi:hypothetical protein